jgi:hypothetical protein
MMVKPERAPVIVRQVCNSVPFSDFHQTPLQYIGFDPFYRFLDIQDIGKQNGTYNPVEIRSGYDSHKRISKKQVDVLLSLAYLAG